MWNFSQNSYIFIPENAFGATSAQSGANDFCYQGTFLPQSLDTDIPRPFYYVATVAPPLLERSYWTAKCRTWDPSIWSSCFASQSSHSWEVDSYESRNTKQKIPKLYQYIKIDACSGFTVLTQVVMPLFPHFLVISFDYDFQCAGSGNVDVSVRISTIAVLWCAQNLNTINPYALCKVMETNAVI